ncbi:hypothetical protein PISMIDRAFT_685390 [Pisolithus microcarpus 441]|uniref:Uncharacterized protein n=1 Tax=Pisolithus microcarpus 441 TaxID=765257 RepID=A0A0C9XXX1_9AGAM|nr:hypothetical protein PISMIDRAFT_685390 [Pisolithus microcarpus 441]
MLPGDQEGIANIVQTNCCRCFVGTVTAKAKRDLKLRERDIAKSTRWTYTRAILLEG